MIRWMLLAYAFMLPFETLWEHLFAIDTIFKPYRILGLAIAGSWAIKSMATGRPLRFDRYDVLLLLFLLGGLAVAAFWYVFAGTGSLDWAYNGALLTSFPLIVIFAMKNEMASIRDFERMFTFLVLGTCIGVAAALVMDPASEEGRFAAFCTNPNQLGLIAAVSINVLLHRLLFGDRLGFSGYLLRLAVVLGLAAALLFSGSRGSIIGFVGSFAVQVWLAVRDPRSGWSARTVRMVLLVPVVALVALVATTAIEKYQDTSVGLQRYQYSSLQSGSGRFDVWRSAWQVTADHYFLGVGKKQYVHYHRAYVGQLTHLYSPGVEKHDLGTHSQYIEMLTSVGLIGLFAYLWMLWDIGRSLWRGRAKNGIATTALGLVFLTLLCIVNVTRSTGSDPVYYLLLGTIAWLAANWPRSGVPSRGHAPKRFR